MVLDVGGKTDIGLRRSKNEDSFCVEGSSGLLIVADGVGGSASGDVASKMAVELIRDYLVSGDKGAAVNADYREEFSFTTNKVAMAVKVANRAIHNASVKNDKLSGMATTIVVGLVHDDRLSIAHAGDSRLYLIRGDSIEQLTDDHSLIAEQIRKGMMTQEEAKEVGMRNVITRSLGYSSSVEVELGELTVYDGDVLLLCSDGLYTMVSDNSIMRTVKSSKNPDDVCNRLVEFANKKGGRDNITVVVAYVYKKRWFSFLYNLFKRRRR
ncbi:Stp1/IreP family PP2C-type Ser/Thr phosphatase [Candidatus Magnetobacterium casense]|uniref:Stp1/IreP family PP2C-type Ser/Thr phosphatase n=1 Tax=Candidatus Magnetobacterium casense TaxID=1455061 RepID=A0ABS6RX28_9BACT|nr:Stp1/IreP family PP2C-type Ser/Thr phosphatase [Candidatus Magnetobacterium casensis]MBV6341192.1 Stp1/IreP family PP2C-type Ser/Thr phosphatase [Candidatus Magnetobacterium casensis]